MFSPVLSVAAKYPDHVWLHDDETAVRIVRHGQVLLVDQTIDAFDDRLSRTYRAHRDLAGAFARACLEGLFGNFRRRSSRKRTQSELKTALSTSDTRAGRAVSARRSNRAANIVFFVNTPIVRMQTTMPPAAGVSWTAVRRTALRKILRFSSRNRRIRQTRPMRLRPSSEVPQSCFLKALLQPTEQASTRRSAGAYARARGSAPLRFGAPAQFRDLSERPP